MDIESMTDGLISHAAALGFFDRVNMHEPKNAPGNGVTYAIWCQGLTPLPLASGLASTTVRVEFNGRVYTSMLTQPQDIIDINVIKATDALMASYSGDFTLGGQVRDIDLLGEQGAPLSAAAGYLNVDSKMYRVMTLTIPMIVNDLWTQAE